MRRSALLAYVSRAPSPLQDDWWWRHDEYGFWDRRRNQCHWSDCWAETSKDAPLQHARFPRVSSVRMQYCKRLMPGVVQRSNLTHSCSARTVAPSISNIMMRLLVLNLSPVSGCVSTTMPRQWRTTWVTSRCLLVVLRAPFKSSNANNHWRH